MTIKKQLTVNDAIQEASAIKCPNCEEEMELIAGKEGKEKWGKCDKCGYIEPNYHE